MVSNLIEMFMGSSGKELATLASSLLGENAENTTTSITKLIPVILGGMAQKASTPRGASDLFKMVTSPSIDSGIAGNLSNILSGDLQNNPLVKSGLGLAASLFGADKANGLMSSLASVTGISPSSSNSLVGMVMPLVFGGIKHMVNDKSLDANGLSSLLLGQKEYLQKADLDRGLLNSIGVPSSAALLDKLPASLDAGKATVAGVAAAATTATATTASSGSLMKWLPWLAAGLVALAIWNIFSSKKPVETPAVVATPAASMSFTYPGKVYFPVGAKDLDEDAKKIIVSIGDAIKKDANKLSITGYADKTGDDKMNEELAKNRAMAVKDALIAVGVKEDAIEMRRPIFITGAQDDKEARRVDINRE
jgi:outer membrane protein OmpA-like peptidoglycan-associated protein